MSRETISEVENRVREKFISEILKTMVTPNLQKTVYSDEDEKLYKEFVKSASDCKRDLTVTLPFDFIIRDELFNLIKNGNAFVVSSVKFKAVVSTVRPKNLDSQNEFLSKYKDSPFSYTFLDNHPGIINVDKIRDIPVDYEGLMAVPATILEYKNLIRFNAHRVIYTPTHSGKKIYPRVVISNKLATME